jgi:hypothetical protein
LLAIVTVPDTLPAAVGSKETLKLAVWFGVRIKPALAPESLNPVPLTLTLEMVIFELPVFFSDTLCEVVVSRLTLPKDRFEGETLSEYVAVPPVPLRPIANGELGALLESETEPVEDDAEVGPNATLKDADSPALIVSGVVKPETLKPVPVTLNCEMVRLALPGLEMVTGWELVWPTVTAPKLTLDGLALI